MNRIGQKAECWIIELSQIRHTLSMGMNKINSYLEKTAHLPKTLFRYRSLDRAVGEIRDEYVWFSSPLDNNDPFDSWPSMEGCDSDIRQLLREQGLDDTGIIADCVCGDREMIVIGKLLELLGRYAICCFTARADSLQMWSLYARNHSGICIEYDVPALSSLGALKQVMYSEKMLARPFRESTTPDMRELVKAFFDKSSEYKSEEEWRIVETNKGKVHLSDCIRGVYLGTNYRILKEEEIALLKELIAICGERDIPLYVMHRSFTDYHLTPVRINGENLSEEGRMELFNLNRFLDYK